MRERERNAAREFGFLDRLVDLENSLLDIKHVVGVEFDLDGFYSDIRQVILVPEYDIPVSLSNYFSVKAETVQKILGVAEAFGLKDSGDSIEDYGKHFYIVRDCDVTWKRKDQEAAKEDNDGVLERFGLDGRDEEFRYRMLSRMQADCSYYLGYGNRHAKHLWAGNEKDHIACMKALWESFPEDGKPEWLTFERIEEYEKQMCSVDAILENAQNRASVIAGESKAREVTLD